MKVCDNWHGLLALLRLRSILLRHNSVYLFLCTAVESNLRAHSISMGSRRQHVFFLFDYGAGFTIDVMVDYRVEGFSIVLQLIQNTRISLPKVRTCIHSD